MNFSRGENRIGLIKSCPVWPQFTINFFFFCIFDFMVFRSWIDDQFTINVIRPNIYFSLVLKAMINFLQNFFIYFYFFLISSVTIKFLSPSFVYIFSWGDKKFCVCACVCVENKVSNKMKSISNFFLCLHDINGWPSPGVLNRVSWFKSFIMIEYFFKRSFNNWSNNN